MAFSFGAQKSATGFTLPTTSTPATTTNLQFNASGAGGDLSAATQAKPGGLLGATAPSSTVISTSVTSSPFSIGGLASSTASTAATAPQANFSSWGSGLAPATSTTSLFAAPTAVSKPSTGFTLGAPAGQANATSAPSLSFSLPATATTSLGAVAPAINTSVASSLLPATGSMTYSQLEDAINKWTVDLEDQGKLFANQAKHLNAWDRLLITNGEMILNVSNGIDKMKDQQKQLDQELDFVLAQQKELEDCIAPLENELKDVPITDLDREQTYKLAENTDAHLKQMSEDLKEIIEQINESNKAQELSDPIAQIGRILNAHMNSLQWIDRNTSLISSHLDEIAKMHDFNTKHHDYLREP